MKWSLTVIQSALVQIKCAAAARQSGLCVILLRCFIRFLTIVAGRGSDPELGGVTSAGTDLAVI